MYKNYFYLNKLIIEANLLLSGSKVLGIFSQEKDKLIIELLKNNEAKFIEISVNPGTPYITVKDSFHRAKRNTVTLFNNYTPSLLISFEIAVYDRIIKVNFESSSLYFAIRGKFTNLHLIDKKNNIFSFKKTDNKVEENFLHEVNLKKFNDKYNYPKIEVLNGTDPDRNGIRKKYPFIGKEIIAESKARAANTDKNQKEILMDVIEEINKEKTAVFYDENSDGIEIAFSTFNIFPYSEIKLFNNIFSAFNYFISKKYFSESMLEKKKKIRKHIEKELSKITSKLNSLKSRIDRGSSEKEYNKIGSLLLINLHSLKKGMNAITIEDIHNNETISVKLDPSQSSKQNVDHYFDKSKSERINFEKSKELYKNVKKQFLQFKNLESKFNEAESKEDYLELMKELKIKDEGSSSPNENLKNKFKQYIIEGKYNLYVGKDSKNNDLLTTKFAKQNDYWLHARSVSGSHVVLRVNNTKEAVPKNILKKAAAIAAYHSKAKTSGLAPVSFTLKKYVIKRKGMEPGKVALLKEDVLLVKPEIPDNCEFISNE